MKSSERTSGRHRWGLILTGGEGRRLLPFTLSIRGNDRPKQFCTVMGSETLLQQTQRRISKLIPAVCISPGSHFNRQYIPQDLQRRSNSAGVSRDCRVNSAHQLTMQEDFPAFLGLD